MLTQAIQDEVDVWITERAGLRGEQATTRSSVTATDRRGRSLQVSGKSRSPSSVFVIGGLPARQRDSVQRSCRPACGRRRASWD